MREMERREKGKGGGAPLEDSAQSRKSHQTVQRVKG